MEMPPQETNREETTTPEDVVESTANSASESEIEEQIESVYDQIESANKPDLTVMEMTPEADTQTKDASTSIWSKITGIFK